MRPTIARIPAALTLGALAATALPAAAADDDGFQVRGYVHYYDRDFDRILPGSTPGETSEVRRLRPILEYKSERWSARFMPDLMRETNKALDAYVDYTPDAPWDLRIGRFKSAASIDQLKSTTAVAATEGSLVAGMTPSRDDGILFGYGGKEGLPWRYEVGLVDGAADGEVKGGLDRGAEWIARVTRTADVAGGELGFGLGVGGGQRDGETGNARLARYRTQGQATWFRYRGDAYADGSAGRVVAYADYYGGPRYAQLELARTRETVRLGAVRDAVDHRGWELQAGYVLTGDDRTFRGVKPGNFVLPGLELPLAVELTGRVGRVDIDDDAFDAVSDPAGNGRNAELAALSLGLWFPKQWRITAEYGVTRVEDAASGDHDSEGVLTMVLAAGF